MSNKIFLSRDNKAYIRHLSSNQKESGSLADVAWRYYDSPVEDFCENFADVVPKGDLVSYIQSRFRNKQLPAVEFGGPGVKLFDSFGTEIFPQTAGVCLDEIEKRGFEERNEVRPTHNIIIGDFLKGSTYNKLKEVFGSNRFGLILSKLDGGLEYAFPKASKEPLALMLLKKWYTLLSDEGEIFAQYATTITNTNGDSSGFAICDLREMDWFAKYLHNKYPSIEVVVSPSSVRLTKKTTAPKKINTDDYVPFPDMQAAFMVMERKLFYTVRKNESHLEICIKSDGDRTKLKKYIDYLTKYGKEIKIVEDIMPEQAARTIMSRYETKFPNQPWKNDTSQENYYVYP